MTTIGNPVAGGWRSVMEMYNAKKTHLDTKYQDAVMSTDDTNAIASLSQVYNTHLKSIEAVNADLAGGAQTSLSIAGQWRNLRV